MTTWYPKDPAETVAYFDDWTGELNGDPITTWDFIVATGTATIASSDRSGYLFRFLIAGGATGTTSTFQLTVRTAAGQELTREYSLYIVSGANNFQPTTTTKRTLIGQAFAECALNSWELDITPDEQAMALTRLDGLMWELMGRGVELGYNFPTAIGAGDLDDELGCPDQTFSGLAVLLALRYAPTTGKQMSLDSRRALNDAMKSVRNASQGYIPSMRLTPGTPLGSGNKPWSTRYPYTSTTGTAITAYPTEAAATSGGLDGGTA